jgi:hypothetical protein
MGSAAGVHQDDYAMTLDSEDIATSEVTKMNKLSITQLFNKPKKPPKVTMSESEIRKLLADTNLKTALTHPVILQYFGEYMKVIGNEDLLNFYLDVVELRKLHDNKDLKGVYGCPHKPFSLL